MMARRDRRIRSRRDAKLEYEASRLGSPIGARVRGPGESATWFRARGVDRSSRPGANRRNNALGDGSIRL
jgi:hypothetical protein